MINLGNITQFDEDLDFLSTHIYPQSKKMDESVSYVKSNQSTIPLVITETFNLSCSISELSEFLDRIEGKYEGMFGHYLKKLSKLFDDSIQDLIIKAFNKFFIERNPNKNNDTYK